MEGVKIQENVTLLYIFNIINVFYKKKCPTFAAV